MVIIVIEICIRNKQALFFAVTTSLVSALPTMAMVAFRCGAQGKIFFMLCYKGGRITLNTAARVKNRVQSSRKELF